ncbi:transcription initiation factor TFIID subunit 3-like isoform X1 [Aphis gossypii]|uniref:transcription initiation factor TFIID subunit 3-like isoform X1 n=2 Tax=Aphis gossypii TaxID=80765 RepID=UPI0021598775|nr:transcription initiation factor TFIID subunit 3-like isoform X1 [Aphis gossypii]XP_050061093.1 transcription initiation factor TFIID subunit 3-like isoform X1 [Aphis gossypii]
MTDEFIRKGLTTSVAQICSNIGWHSMSNSTLQMMTDILYEYFRDLAQSVKKFSEISDTTEPDIDDVKMAFRDKDVAVPDLIRYLKQVGSIEFPHQVPKFPIPTKSNLNIMKPGSREIVTRPVYVHEHLPTMYPEQSDEKPMQNDRSQTPHSSSSLGIFNEPLSFQESQVSKYDRPLKDNLVVHRRLREISSVVMTTSGFLSPSREGKLPESRLMPFPNFKVNSSHASSSYPTVPPEVKGEHNQQRNKKLSQKTLNSFKEKGKNIVDSNNSNIINNNKSEDSKVRKLTNVKETSKLKALMKTGAIRESNQGPRLKKPPKIKDKSKLSVLNTIFDKPIQTSTSHSKYSKNFLCDSEKLTTEPDKQKLNIFKKISKVKEDKNNDSSVHQSSKLNSLINISKPNSTIVSSDILVKPEVNLETVEEKQFKPGFTKPTVETKKPDTVQKPIIKETKPELNSNIPKKRKKKQKIPSDDNSKNADLKTKNTGNKKSKNKHDSDLFSSPLKFSFFGHLPTVPGLLPTVPSILPPSLASNPLVPKYTAPNSVLPILEKPSTATSMMYLPLPGEDDFDKSEFDELSSTLTPEKKKVSTEKIKPKKEHKKIKKEKIKSKKKKDKKDKTKQKDRSERKKEKLLKKLKNKEKIDSEEIKLEPNISEEKESEPVVKEEDPLVPKIKLKIPGSNGSNSSSSVQRKILIKPIVKNKSPSECIDESHNLSKEKEKSPVERVKSTTKSKAHSKEKISTTTLLSTPLVPNKEEQIESVTEPIPKPSKSKKNTIVPLSADVDTDISATTSINASVSSALINSIVSSNKHKVKLAKKSKKIAPQPHPAFYYDDAGNQVWICPTCGKQDDGSPMVGCDGCDAWYHWVCVGIQCPPDCAVWYCPTCLLKRAERGVTTPIEKAKRGRPLKKKSIS